MLIFKPYKPRMLELHAPVLHFSFGLGSLGRSLQIQVAIRIIAHSVKALPRSQHIPTWAFLEAARSEQHLQTGKKPEATWINVTVTTCYSIQTGKKLSKLLILQLLATKLRNRFSPALSRDFTSILHSTSFKAWSKTAQAWQTYGIKPRKKR